MMNGGFGLCPVFAGHGRLGLACTRRRSRSTQIVPTSSCDESLPGPGPSSLAAAAAASAARQPSFRHSRTSFVPLLTSPSSWQRAQAASSTIAKASKSGSSGSSSASSRRSKAQEAATPTGGDGSSSPVAPASTTSTLLPSTPSPSTQTQTKPRRKNQKQQQQQQQQEEEKEEEQQPQRRGRRGRGPGAGCAEDVEPEEVAAAFATEGKGMATSAAASAVVADTASTTTTTTTGAQGTRRPRSNPSSKVQSTGSSTDSKSTPNPVTRSSTNTYSLANFATNKQATAAGDESAAVDGDDDELTTVDGDDDDSSTGDDDSPTFPFMGPFTRVPDGRQLISVMPDTPAPAAGGALSRALGTEGRAVVRFDGGGGGLRGLRVLTLAHYYMGNFRRAMSFVTDVREVAYNHFNHPLSERPRSGDVSFQYRLMARARGLEPHDTHLGAALRRASFLLDLSINVRQAWDVKGDVDEEQSYDLADTLYAVLARTSLESDEKDDPNPGPYGGDEGSSSSPSSSAAAAADGRRQPQQQQRGRSWRGQRQQHEEEGEEGRGSAPRGPPALPDPGAPLVYLTTDLAQGLTTFTALGLLQKRLREEGQKVVVETTLYRAAVSAPRLDGRDGWVFAVRLGFLEWYRPNLDNWKVQQWRAQQQQRLQAQGRDWSWE
ncbi:hypothetical protein Agub_g10659 [Astrephomene gubernaculifera]|uniref:Uncharacterized protein n=1 Tax=Astrephomene gubernaculifera TaxID=47775 RepID=A0AAD3DVN7_9CHLO|nr:hypothetical protein Agub_g10659 [Astrephomene gubernaculifera]